MLLDDPLRQTPTHAHDEHEGRSLGLDLPRIKWVVLALLPGLLVGGPMASSLGLGTTALIMFGPAVLTAVVQVLFLQGKPPGWCWDWLETKLFGGHASPLD